MYSKSKKDLVWHVVEKEISAGQIVNPAQIFSYAVPLLVLLMLSVRCHKL